ncbi:hypothetical protein L6172_01195 [Thalassospiraceae bacterium SW-3-3]|nr:hypothetical protein L6172_01195 [Thalassospiraceae bacterium SW-3-3]
MKLPRMISLLVAGATLLAPINAFACSSGYFRFVETGTASPFVPSASRAYYDDQDEPGTAISVFVDLTSADFKAMADSRRNVFGGKTTVYKIACDAVTAPLSETPAEDVPSDSWMSPEGINPTHVYLEADNFSSATVGPNKQSIPAWLTSKSSKVYSAN